MSRPSKHEVRFALLWRSLGGPLLVPEFRFAPPRRWRADFCHVATRTLIECEGGGWSGGRHTRGAGFEADAEKYLEAYLHGWRVVRLVPSQINSVTLARIISLVTAEKTCTADAGAIS